MRCYLSLALVLAGAAVYLASAAESKTETAKERIGIYDSRSVAVAFTGSEPHKRWMLPLVEEHKKAKDAGNQKRIKELEAEGQARQRRAHSQGFATAPVDEILKQIEDKLPAIKQRAGVTVLVSKWNKEELARHQGAEQVDVTLALVDAFNPSARQRKYAIDLQRTKPISIREAEHHKD